MNLLDSRLGKDLEKYLSSNEIKAKFYKFKSILNELQQTTTWVWMFRWRRVMVIVMNILRNICYKYQFDCERIINNTLPRPFIHLYKAFPYVIICLFLKIETSKNSIVQFHLNIITPSNLTMGNELKSQQKHFIILLFNYDKDLF